MLDRPKRSLPIVDYCEKRKKKKTKPSSSHGNIHASQSVILKDANQRFILSRTQNNNNTKPIPLEKVESVPEQTMIDATSYKGSKIYCFDVGSSYVKGCFMSIWAIKKTCNLQPLKFFSSEFLPNTNWRKKDNGLIVTGLVKVEDPNEWDQIENIKKVFMVSELSEIALKSGTTLRVASIIEQVTKNVLNASVTTKGNGQKALFQGLKALVFTCPTDTNENTKKIYRNCIKKAYEDLTASLISLDDIYVIEEAPLIKHYAAPILDSDSVVMFIDLGHLTLDMIIMEKDMNDEEVVKFKNSETGGMSLLQDAFEKNNINYFETMAKLFEYSEISELPEELKNLEPIIRDVFETITQPIAMIMLQQKVTEIHFTGALTQLDYFAKILEEMVSKPRLQQVKIALQPYLREQHKDEPIPDCKFRGNNTGKSALLEGLHKMLKTSIQNDESIDIILRDDCSSFENTSDGEKYVPAMLIESVSDEGLTEKEIYIQIVPMEAFVKQDTEIFLLKFSPLVDISQISKITKDNYKELGITEFVRFTNLIMCFDPNLKLKTHDYFLKLDLDSDYLMATFYVRRSNRFDKMVTKIDRSGRLEKVPINDAEKIFNTAENETQFWYGGLYETLFVISSATLTTISFETLKSEIGEELAEAFKSWDHNCKDNLAGFIILCEMT